MFKISLTHLHYTQYIFVTQSEGSVKINKEFVKRILFHGIEGVLSHTGYFTSDNEQSGIKNATHNTFPKLKWLF
jgi:hypothetical protein